MARAPKVPDEWAEIRRQNRLAAGKVAAPADQPEPAAPLESHQYEVLGGHTVFDAEPGSVVELALTEGEERALVESGHLARVDEMEAAAPVVEEVAEEAEEAPANADQDDLTQ